MTESKLMILEKIKSNSIKAVIDIVILKELRNSGLSGYDMISKIHEKFGVLISSGTVYSHLYALERDGLIEGTYDVKRRIYELTQKGKEIVEQASETNKELLQSIA